MKTHWKKAFNSDYLGAVDLPDYQDLVLTIREVKLEKTTTKEQEFCNVAYFVEKVKPMILNVENSRNVMRFAGSRFIEEWQNIPVTVYVKTDIKAFGTLTDGLRIRPTQPQQKEELTPEHPKWDKLKEKKPTFELLTKHYIISDENYKKFTDS